MPSDERLHPASILFGFGKSVKSFAAPGLLVLVSTRFSGGSNGPVPDSWQVWMMLFLIPSAVLAVARYLSFRLSYHGSELVIRSGILFRNERHLPYARIQNLDAVQNVWHRLFSVVEVRVETGGGDEPEARISVLARPAFEEMRRRVFADRSQPAPLPKDAASELDPVSAQPEEEQTILRLSPRELMLFAFIESRGLVVIGALFGLLSEFGLLDRLRHLVLGHEADGRGFVRALVAAIASGRPVPMGRIAVGVVSIAALLLAAKLVSMAWAAARLYGFRVLRAGDDLRTEFGLFTRVSATIPLRRIQTMTIREGPLQRLVKRVSARVETAGGQKSGASAAQREWLAPIMRVSESAALVRQIVPGLDILSTAFQPVHPRAFRRAVKPGGLMWLVASLAAALPLGWWALGLFAIGVIWTVIAARQRVAHLGWAATDDVVLFRSGWIWRTVTIARVEKVQAVALVESPFDRRSGMARLHVDTAGATERSHRVHIPYLSRATADDLRLRLAAQAASTAFRW